MRTGLQRRPPGRAPWGQAWRLTLLALCALAAGPLPGAPPDRASPLLDTPEVSAPPAPKYAERQLLVRFGPGVPEAWQAATHAGVKTKVLRRFRHVRDLELVELPDGLSVEEAIQAYRRDPNVLYAEPNYIRHALLEPNDPAYVAGNLWGLKYPVDWDPDIDAPEAWDITTGSSDVVVVVIDTGIDYTHEDLAANMMQLESNCADGIDNDGNGFVDDCYGIDTANNDRNPRDGHGHGTHVAGTIGAAGNNGLGVVGVNWTVKLLACKFLDDAGFGSDAGAIACLDYVKDLKERGVNIVATNNSWGGGGFSQALYDAIDAQRPADILFIAAAGNDGNSNDGVQAYPASFYLPNVISVAAANSGGGLAWFSNFGKRTVHLAAPGDGILSTTPGNTYSVFSGTSMAAPHVTGVAALLKSQDPSRDWIAIKNLLLAGGRPMPISGFPTMTGKRLKAYGSLTCSNSVVKATLRPTMPSLAAVVGVPIDLAVLHINCDQPNGPVQVGVSIINTLVDTVTLADDGAGTDQVGGDGIYSGQWTPPDKQDYTLYFPDGTSTEVKAVENYRVTPAAFSYRTITGTNLNLGDDTAGSISLPFAIGFGGRALSFPSVRITSNGFLHFFPYSDPFPNPNRPIPNLEWITMVAPFWDDLYPRPDSGRNVFWAVTGEPPHRELVVEWRGVGHYECRTDSAARVRFQAVLFEGSNSILFNYADTHFGGGCGFANRGGSATVGVQPGRGAGMQSSFDSPVVEASSALLWELDAEAPAPALESLSPSSLAAGGPVFTLRVNGDGFTSGSMVQWNGSNRDTLIASPTQLQATIPAGDIAGVGTAAITVFTPAPGGGTSSPLPFAINPNSFFRGKVRDSSKVGIPDVTVGAYQGGMLKFSTTTNAKGRYALNTAAGTYDLAASKPGLMERSKLGLAVGVDQRVTGVNFRLLRESFFLGTVTSAADGSPIAGATVEAWRKGALRYSTTADPSGNFALLVSRGTYTLRVSAPGFNPGSKKNLAVSEGDVLRGVDFALTPQ